MKMTSRTDLPLPGTGHGFEWDLPAPRRFTMPLIYFVLFVGLLPGLSAHADPKTVTLSNDQVEVRVDLEHGLIIGFGQPGKANLLWVNPQPVSSPARNNGWINYGGEKLWWAPMDDWQGVKGRRLPPDEALDGAWEIVHQAADRLVMRSGVSPWVGIRGEREITLVPHSTEIIVRNQFQRVRPSAQRLQLWTVNQVPPPLWCLLDSRPLKGEARYVNRRPTLDPVPYTSIVPGSGSVRFDYNEVAPNLIGTRGSWIAAIYADYILTQQVEPFANGDYVNDIAVQLFTIKGFVELETFSTVAKPKVGEGMSNTIRWRVLPRPPELSDDELALWVRDQMTGPVITR